MVRPVEKGSSKRVWVRFVDAKAVFLSEIFAPPPLLVVLLLEVGFLEAGWTGAGFALVAALFVAIGPYVAVIVLSRMGVVSDRFVANRKQRAPILSC